MPKNSRFPKISCCQLPRLRWVAATFILGLSLLYLVACQPAAPAPVDPTLVSTAAQPVATPEPPPPTFTPIPSPTETPLPTLAPPTILPTPRPADTPTPDPVWSILFTGRPCFKDADDCLAFSDTPPSKDYFIYSDGTGLQPLSEMGIPYDNIGDTVETIQLSSDLKRVAYMDDDNHGHFRFWIGDVDGSNFTEIYANAQHFYPFSFFGNDPNCLAGFDEQRKNGEIIVTLYKSCIGDTEPALVDTAVLPIAQTRVQYRLSPQGDKWLAYSIGQYTRGDEAVLYVRKIGDANPPQLLFQQQPASCTPIVHWQDNETIEFLYAICGSSNNRTTYFYVTDWKGKELTTRYELPALEVFYLVSTDYYTPEAGDWYSDNNLFIFSLSIDGSPPPEFNGLFVLNLITGEIQQILSDFFVFDVHAWLPVTTNIEE